MLYQLRLTPPEVQAFVVWPPQQRAESSAPQQEAAPAPASFSAETSRILASLKPQEAAAGQQAAVGAQAAADQPSRFADVHSSC